MRSSDEHWTHELRYPLAVVAEVRNILLDEFGQSWDGRFKLEMGVLFAWVRCCELDALFLSTALPPKNIEVRKPSPR
jgi:hypothetical protein